MTTAKIDQEQSSEVSRSGRALAAHHVAGEAIKVGDVIIFLGHEYLIDNIEAIAETCGFRGWRCAYSGDWKITLMTGQTYWCRRAAR